MSDWTQIYSDALDVRLGGVDALLAQHRAVFGDALMTEAAPEVVHTTETETVKTEQPDTAKTDATTDAKTTEPDTGESPEVAKWKAMARKHEQAAKANAEAAKKLAAIEDANKTEQERAAESLQKAAKSAAEADARAAEAEARALRLEVAFEKGLTPGQAKRLVGTSREELEADAADILENFPVKSDGRPKGDADQGVRPTPAKEVAPGLDRLRYAYEQASK